MDLRESLQLPVETLNKISKVEQNVESVEGEEIYHSA
jgi:hypothetical protein